ncbi:unnamed protein product [Cochlearia groenlandica]
MSYTNHHTNILCKYLVILCTIAIFFIFIFFNINYIYPQTINSNILAIKCEETFLQPTEPAATNLSHLMFTLVGSSRALKSRRTFTESWWRPNVTRGNIFLDKEPSQEFKPWSPNFPTYKVSEDPKKLKIYWKRKKTVHVRIYRAILETYRLKQDDGIRWYVMGDDDSLFFLDNIVEVLSKYDHNEKHYLGTYSESTKSNVRLSFEMGYGGAGFAISYPLVEALVARIDECGARYHNIWAADQLESVCMSDLGVDFFQQKGFHQMDLRGDVSGLLSSHPTALLLSLHHLEVVAPFFPNMDRPNSVQLLMKAANVDQSRILQQSICHVRSHNWTFSVSWGYSAHIYENIFSRSTLIRPIETFRPWLRGGPVYYMFNTRRVSKNPCEAPHWLFFDSIKQEKDEVVTSYTRKYPRNMTSCSLSGNISADPVALIRVFSPNTHKQGERIECCDVQDVNSTKLLEVKIRACHKNEVLA